MKFIKLKKHKIPAFFAKNYPDVDFTVITNDNWVDFIASSK
jgi:hypothetical protein